MNKLALISVSDRTGLEEFAKTLVDCGFSLLATSGSAKFLDAAGIKTISIEDYTGQKEILDGRVKTLHPKIHAGLLAKRGSDAHMKQLEEEGILPIDIAVVNLYPFVKGLASDAAQDPKKMIELVDIGGPTMIRAAAKNFASVLPVIDPADYAMLAGYLSEAINREFVPEIVPQEIRAALSAKVFAWLADYNLQIARYISNLGFSNQSAIAGTDAMKAPVNGLVLTKAQELRYGENPQQKGVFYHLMNGGSQPWEQLNGKELSYNNLLDFDAALRLIRSFAGAGPTVAILKHLNPCGAAYGANLSEALHKAKQGDPRSHFGGVLAFNKAVDTAEAEAVAEDFAEIVVAPDFTGAALSVFQKKKNLRVIRADLNSFDALEWRSVAGGFLLQETDPGVSPVKGAQCMSDRTPTDDEYRDLQFAWTLCAHLKSNAISIVKDGMLLAAGAGQMSRIDSVEVALMKARTHGHDLKGAVAASDAFFPFTDSLETLAGAGISAVIAPSGAKRDDETVRKAKELGISLLFATDRHFRH